MRRSVRATAAAAAVVLTMGAGTSAAVAGGHAGAKGPHAAQSAHAKPGKPVKASKIDRDRVNVLREVARDRAALERFAGRKAVRKLPADLAALVGANAVEDAAYLDTLVTQAKAATTKTELRAVTAALKAFRPEVYNPVISSLTEIGELTAAVEEAWVTYAGVVEAEEHLEVADAALVTAEEAALAVHATSPKSDLDAVRGFIAEAEAALEAAELAGDSTDDTTEEPVVDPEPETDPETEVPVTP